MLGILKDFSPNTKLVLIIGLVGVVIQIPVCTVLIVLNSGDLSLSTENIDLELNNKATELTAVDNSSTEKLEQEFNKLKQDYLKLKEQAKKKKLLKVLSPELKEIDNSVEQTELRLQDATQSSEQLNEFVESAIAES